MKTQEFERGDTVWYKVYHADPPFRVDYIQAVVFQRIDTPGAGRFDPPDVSYLVRLLRHGKRGRDVGELEGRLGTGCQAIYVLALPGSLGRRKLRGVAQR